VDRHTRKELKGDKFAEEVFDIFDWATMHKAEVARYGAIVLAVVAIVVGVIYYNRYQAGAREEALAQALRVDDATAGDNNSLPANLHYASDDEKTKARVKAYTELSTKYSGTQEGAFGTFALASDAVDKGDLAQAEKLFRQVADAGPKGYSGVARLALARVLAAEGKPADAQKILQDLVKDPSFMVSKEQATIALAQVEAQTNPAEALKLLDPLRVSQRLPVGRVAVSMYGEIEQANSLKK
jgi:predicted negative regulator of RcsB-dependent stress response